MSEGPDTHSGGGMNVAGHHLNPKLLAVGGGVVLLLFLIKSRSSAAASTSSATPDPASTASSTAAMLSQLQQDNAQAIADALAQIPAGATGPPGKQGPTGPPGKPGPVPPGTVHQPTGHTGSGVPVTTGHFYTVRSGDTLSGIAQSNHVTGGFKSLLNSRTDATIRQHPNLIRPGQKVWIPK